MPLISGSIFDDTLDSSVSGDTLSGLGGDDTLTAHGQLVTMYGGDGDDFLGGGFGGPISGIARFYGGDGNDELQGGSANDLLDGGAGSDFFDLSGGHDSIFGGAGVDTLELFIYQKAVNFTLGDAGTGSITILAAANLGFTGVTTYTGIEGVVGGGFNDTLRGNTQDNALIGSSGTDLLFGMAGNDALWGDEGHDTLTGGKGHDSFVFFGEEDRHKLAADADVITDFDPTQDNLVFFNRNFTGLHNTPDDAGGVMGDFRTFNLDPTQFAIQTDRFAHTTAVRLIYDKDDGLLYYDADGALSGHKSILIADIGKNLILDASHIFIY